MFVAQQDATRLCDLLDGLMQRPAD
jgi:hypothetical protein